MQPKTALGKEMASHWKKIMAEKTDEFDTVAKVIANLEEVTHSDVRDMFDLIFFESPRRLNYKAYRPSDVPNTEAIKFNEDFYNGSHFYVQGKNSLEFVEVTEPRKLFATHALNKVRK